MEKNRVEGGRLYLVATPIGNLSDISERGVKVLSEVDFIAAEDTRNTAKLLVCLGIHAELVSYFEHNKRERGEIICQRIEQGENCAIVTDAGMPCISDPGEDLVRTAREIGIEIEPVGGSWDDIDPVKFQEGEVWGFGSADPYGIEHQYDSRVANVGYDNTEGLIDPTVDSLIDSAKSQELESSYATWSQAAQQATSQYPYLWIGTMDYTYFVSDSLDISNSTHLIYPHGGDIWGNIYDWKRVNTTDS